MALDNNIQERIERSLFEAIRLVLVNEGYLPNVTDAEFQTPATKQKAWEAALATITTAKTFAAEIYGSSRSHAKGNKHVPRIVINSQRITPGDVGTPGTFGFQKDPNDPNTKLKSDVDLSSSHMYLDVHIVAGTSAQERILNLVINEALGVKRFITTYDDPTDKFLLNQTNYQDWSDEIEGEIEKIYSYQVPDIYLYNKLKPLDTGIITEITLETTLAQIQSKFLSDGIIIGPYVIESTVIMDLSGITFA